jgi:hypothetical protein
VVPAADVVRVTALAKVALVALAAEALVVADVDVDLVADLGLRQIRIAPGLRIYNPPCKASQNDWMQ